MDNPRIFQWTINNLEKKLYLKDQEVSQMSTKQKKFQLKNKKMKEKNQLKKGITHRFRLLETLLRQV